MLYIAGFTAVFKLETVAMSKPPLLLKVQIGHFPPFVPDGQAAFARKASEEPKTGRFSTHVRLDRSRPSLVAKENVNLSKKAGKLKN